jgi:hypothetical protein
VQDKFGKNCQNQDLFTFAKAYGIAIGKKMLAPATICLHILAP